MIERDRLNLEITDIRMPKMEGLGLLGYLHGKFPQLPVVAVSGYLYVDEDRVRDFDGFINKLVSLAELRSVVENAVEQWKKMRDG